MIFGKNILAGIILVLSLIVKAEVNAPVFPTEIQTEQGKLLLNGVGTREKYSIDLYRAGLYLKEKTTNPEVIISSGEPMIIRIEVVSDLITSKRLEDNMRKEFDRKKGESEAFDPRIEKLISAFKEEVKKGDIFELKYTTNQELKVSKNKKLVTVISGKDFKELVFSIWLAEDPADEDLKSGLLGNE